MEVIVPGVNINTLTHSNTFLGGFTLKRTAGIVNIFTSTS